MTSTASQILMYLWSSKWTLESFCKFVRVDSKLEGKRELVRREERVFFQLLATTWMSRPVTTAAISSFELFQQSVLRANNTSTSFATSFTSYLSSTLHFGQSGSMLWGRNFGLKPYVYRWLIVVNNPPDVVQKIRAIMKGVTNTHPYRLLLQQDSIKLLDRFVRYSCEKCRNPHSVHHIIITINK